MRATAGNVENNGRNVLTFLFLGLFLTTSLFGAGTDNWGLALWNKFVWLMADTGLGYIGAAYGLIEAVSYRKAGENTKALEAGAIGASVGVFTTVAEAASGAMIF